MNPDSNTPPEMGREPAKETSASTEASQQGTQINTASPTNPVHLNAPAGAEIELAEIHVNTTPSVLIHPYTHWQTEESFTLTPDQLGAPTAQVKDSLFDWQMEGDGPKTVERFGGIDAIVKKLHTNTETVRIDDG